MESMQMLTYTYNQALNGNPWALFMGFLALNLAASLTLFTLGTILELKKPKSRS